MGQVFFCYIFLLSVQVTHKKKKQKKIGGPDDCFIALETSCPVCVSCPSCGMGLLEQVEAMECFNGMPLSMGERYVFFQILYKRIKVCRALRVKGLLWFLFFLPFNFLVYSIVKNTKVWDGLFHKWGSLRNTLGIRMSGLSLGSVLVA